MKSKLMSFGAAFTLTLGLLGPATLSLASPSTASDDTAALREALDGASRPDADKARDAGRKPADVMHFLGIGPGMTVMDVMASGGYYTEVLSLTVGETGTVYAQNPPGFLQWNDGYYEKALSERLAGNRLPNVKRINTDIPDSGIVESSVDAAITALNFHDLYNDKAEDGIQALKDVYAILEPGGTLGLIDHHGNADADNAALHRIHIDLVIAAAKQAGFEIAGQSDLLSNPDDDHTKTPFDPSIRGKTDRFLLRLGKPE